MLKSSRLNTFWGITSLIMMLLIVGIVIGCGSKEITQVSTETEIDNTIIDDQGLGEKHNRVIVVWPDGRVAVKSNGLRQEFCASNIPDDLKEIINKAGIVCVEEQDSVDLVSIDKMEE